MQEFERYAVFAAPRPETALAAFGRGWLGYDAETGACEATSVTLGLDRATHRDAVAAPARYGFHGTLKAPFRLAEGFTETDLVQAVEQVARRVHAFEVPALALATFGGFLALVPEAPNEAVGQMAESCVVGLDALRAPLTDPEIARRAPERLTQVQQRLLADWGYPYVLEEFRFHLTLTGRLDGAALDRLHPLLERATRALRVQPMRVDEICLFGDPGAGHGFRLVRRIALG